MGLAEMLFGRQQAEAPDMNDPRQQEMLQAALANQANEASRMQQVDAGAPMPPVTPAAQGAIEGAANPASSTFLEGLAQMLLNAGKAQPYTQPQQPAAVKPVGSIFGGGVPVSQGGNGQ